MIEGKPAFFSLTEEVRLGLDRKFMHMGCRSVHFHSAHGGYDHRVLSKHRGTVFINGVPRDDVNDLTGLLSTPTPKVLGSEFSVQRFHVGRSKDAERTDD